MEASSTTYEAEVDADDTAPPKTRNTVLVTGASGFVAAHVLIEFLDHGYNVVGTVRNEEAAARVRKTHAKYGDRLSFAIIADVATPDVFDEVVKAVDGVIHVASPFRIDGVANVEKELLIPAIDGTLGLLKSIKAHSRSIRRVIITSSFAAMTDMTRGLWPDHTYTEEDWNPIDYATAKVADAGTAYCAGKTFAEKAAFDFVRTESPNFEITTICPPMIYGPIANPVTTMSQLSLSCADIYRLIDGTESDVPETDYSAFCDVRDVAKAHLLAFESPLAAGQRYLTSAGTFAYQDICDIVRARFPALRHKVPIGKPGTGVGEKCYAVDASKCSRELGMRFRGLEACVVDCVADLLRLEESWRGSWGILEARLLVDFGP